MSRARDRVAPAPPGHRASIHNIRAIHYILLGHNHWSLVSPWVIISSVRHNEAVKGRHSPAPDTQPVTTGAATHAGIIGE